MLTNEGWVYVGVTIILAVLVHNLAGIAFALPVWLCAVFFFWMFRDPMRDIPASPLAVVSPVDGTVVGIETVTDKLLERQAVCVSIKMSWLGIFTTRSPTEGKVVRTWFPHEIESPSGSAVGLWIQTDEEDDVAMIIARFSLFNRPRCYVRAGERIGQGQRCGFVRFGTTIDVYLPENSRIDVAVGDKVRAGSKIIATLVHKE